MDAFQKLICLTKWNGIGDTKALERFGIKIQSEINIKDSTNEKLAKTKRNFMEQDKHFLLKRGSMKNFDEYYTIKQGEAVLITDTKQLGLCFEDGKAEFISFTEDVDKETADRLNTLLERYICASYEKGFNRQIKPL